MVNNVINVSFGAQNKATTRPVWLIDKGMVLKFNGLNLPTAYEVDFSNSETAPAIQMIGDEDGVSIPNSLFTSGTKILAWLRLQPSENVGYTVYQVTIPLQQRPANTGVAPTPQETTIVEQAIAALNAAVEQTGEDVVEAAASAAAALASEQAAAASEINAAASESAAASNAAAAATSASAAAQSERNAAASEANAALSASEAYTSAERAEQAATTAGYLDVEIVNGRLIYTRTDAVDVDFELENGRLLMEVI